MRGPRKMGLTREEVEVAWEMFRHRMVGGQADPAAVMAKCLGDVATAKIALLEGVDEAIVENGRKIGTRTVRMTRDGSAMMIEKPGP